MGIFSKKKPSPPSIPKPPPQLPLLSESAIDQSIKKARDLITNWESNPFFLSHETRGFISTFIALRPVMLSLLSSPSSPPDKILHAQSLTQKSMAILERLFHELLSTHSSINTSSTISEEIKLTADCMIASGYGKECMRAYTTVRKSALESEIQASGIPILRPSDVKKMKQSQLVRKIQQWKNSASNIVNSILWRERTACDYVFSSSDAVREACFLRISIQPAYHLLHFPELLLSRRRIFSSEMIFSLLDLHEKVSSFLPNLDSIFSFKSTSTVGSHARRVKSKLGEAISSMLFSFGASVKNDSSRARADGGGGVHQLTRSVLEYVSRLVQYTGVPPPPDSVKRGAAEEKKEEEEEEEGGVSSWIRWFVLLLLCNLDKKADDYKNISLSYIFLANNLQWIVGYIGERVGEEWAREQKKKVKHYVERYEESAWGRVVGKLKKESWFGREEVVEGFRLFNFEFEKTCRVQRSWVLEEKMKEEVKIYIGKKVVGVYGELYNKHLGILMEENLLVKFSPNNLEVFMCDLFDGDNRKRNIV